MFGGIGLFHQGLMFGMITVSDVFKLKVGDSNKAEFEVLGMKLYQDPKKKKAMPYWQVPEEIIGGTSQLKEWATKSYQAAVDAKK